MSEVPVHELRGIGVRGWPDEAALLADLFDGVTATGIMVAVNAEKVVAAQTDPALRRVLQEAEFPYADGVSIVRSIRRKYGVELRRIPGVDLWQAMMRRAGREGTTVFLLGGRPEVLHAVHRRVRDEWGVRVVGAEHGYTGADRAALIARVRDSGADVVTVALGSPRQELFVRECRQVHPDALYLGVGGTFDVVGGSVRRAPRVLRRFGLEWLYRIATQPTRLRRVSRLLRYAAWHYGNRL